MVLRTREVLLFAAAMVGLGALALPSVRERGLLLVRSGDYVSATPLLQSAAAENPHDWIVVDALADALMRQGETARALVLFERKLINFPRDEELRVKVLDLEWQAGDVEGALATAKHGSSDPLRERYAGMCADLGRWDEAVEILRGLLRGPQDTRTALDRLGVIASLEQARLDYPGAMDAYERIARLAPSLETWDDVMDLARWQGMQAQALEAAKQMEALGVQDATRLRAIRDVRLKARDLPGATRVAAQICARPDSVPADWLLWANIQDLAGQPAETERVLTAALERYPKDLALLHRLGSFLYTQGRYEDAVPWLTRLAKVSGGEMDALQAGYVLYDVGRFKDARRVLDEVLAGREPSARTRFFMAYISLRDNDPAGARVQGLALERLADQDPAAARWAAEVWREVGDTSRWADMLVRVCKDNPNDPALLLQYAHAAAKAERLDEARAVLAKLDKMPDADRVAVRWEKATVALETLWRAARETPLPANIAALRREAVQVVEATLADKEDDSLIAAILPVYLDLERRDDAARWLKKLRNPSPGLRLQIAVAFARMGDPLRARELAAGLKDEDFPLAKDRAGWAWYHVLLKDYARGTALYRQAHALDPNDDAILIGLADAYGGWNDLPSQQSLMNERARKFNTPEAWLDAANRYAWASQLPGEATLLTEALGRLPNAFPLWERQLRVLGALGRLDEARVAWRAMQRIAPNRQGLAPEALLAASQALQASTVPADVAEAAVVTQRLMQQTLEPEVMLGVARLLVRQARHKDAAGFYRKYLAAQPAEPYPWLELASALRQTGEDDRQEIREGLKRLDEIADPPAPLLLEVSALLATRGDKGAARREMARLPGFPKLTVDDLTQAGYVWQVLDLLKEALPCYEEALRRAPDNDALILSAADAFARAGDRPRQFALMEGRAARAKGPGGAQAWLDAADRRRWADDRKGEAAVLDRALAQYPDDALLLARRMSARAFLQRFAGARADYQRLEKLPLEKTGARDVMAVTAEYLARVGELETASHLYDRLRQLDPTDPLPVLGQARVEIKRDRYPQAIVYYREYVQREPKDPRGWYELGEVLFDIHADGTVEQNHVLALMPLTDDPYTLAVHGRILVRRGRYEQAYPLYEKLVQGGVMDVDAACDYAYALRAGGQFEREHVMLERAMAASPGKMRPRRLLASVLLREMQYARAAELLRGLVKEFPGDRGAASELAYAERQQLHYEEAMWAYQLAGQRDAVREAMLSGETPEGKPQINTD